MDWPPIDVPVLGRSGLIALIALVHIPFFVNFVISAPVIAVISEWMGRKTGNHYFDRFSKHLSTMALVTVAVGAFGGIGLVVSNLGLFPKFFTMGVSIFFWPLVLEIFAFTLEAVGIAVYRYTWDKHKHTNGHLAIGLVGAFGAWLSGLIINGLASFMLTPGKWAETQSILDAWFNPTSLASFTHRAMAAFSITGFFMIIYALWKHARSKSEDDQQYAKWSLKYASKYAFVATALQVFPGLWYLTQIEVGTRFAAPEGSVVPKLLAGPLTFFWVGGLLMAAVAVFLVYFLGINNPKAGLSKWGKLGLIVSVLLILATTSFMGFTRERARKPYLVYGVVYGNQMMAQMLPGFMTGESNQPVATVPEEPDATTGKTIFESGTCKACHSINGEGGAVKALDGVGSRYDMVGLKNLLETPPAGMPPFTGTENEIEHLVAYLESLK